MRAALALAVSACLLTGCRNDAPANNLDTALQVADELRQNCVASSLDLLQVVADYVGPAVNARRLDDIESAALDARCTFFGPVESTYHFICPARIIRGETVLIQLELQYLVNGLPVDDPDGAEELRVKILAGGGFLEAEGAVHFRNVPGLGLVMSGNLGTAYFDGCLVDLDLHDITGQAVADLPGTPFGVLFTSGEADIDAQTGAGDPVTGTAGFAGRNAFVALQLFGVNSLGEVKLGQ